MKFVVALLVVALGVAAHATKPTPKKREVTSADVEALLDPEVSSLPHGQHKLVFTGTNGKEQCVVCQPFQGCGCRDVVAIRCELKRIKQKLNRLKRIASPHKRSHHDRNVEDKPKKVVTKIAVKPKIFKPLANLPKPKNTGIVPPGKPLTQPLIKPAVVQPAAVEKKNVA